MVPTRSETRKGTKQADPDNEESDSEDEGSQDGAPRQLSDLTISAMTRLQTRGIITRPLRASRKICAGFASDSRRIRGFAHRFAHGFARIRARIRGFANGFAHGFARIRERIRGFAPGFADS